MCHVVTGKKRSVATKKAPRSRKGPASKNMKETNTNVEEADDSSSESGRVVQKPRKAKVSQLTQTMEKSKKAPPKNSSSKKHVKDEELDNDDESDDDEMHAEALSEEDDEEQEGQGEDDSDDDGDDDGGGGGVGGQRDRTASATGVPPRPTTDRFPDVKPRLLDENIWFILQNKVVPPPHSEQALLGDPDLLLGSYRLSFLGFLDCSIIFFLFLAVVFIGRRVVVHYQQAKYGNRWYFGTINRAGPRRVQVVFDEGDTYDSFDIDYAIRSLL